MEKDGRIYDTLRDMQICGAFNGYDELTLYKNESGYYTYIQNRDECDELVNEEIELNTEEDAIAIMISVGFGDQEIQTYKKSKVIKLEQRSVMI